MPGEVNVLYEIERTTALAGPDISVLLRDGENEVTFLPGSKFVITDIEQAGSQLMKIKMRTFDIEHEGWAKELSTLAEFTGEALAAPPGANA